MSGVFQVQIKTRKDLAKRQKYICLLQWKGVMTKSCVSVELIQWNCDFLTVPSILHVFR